MHCSLNAEGELSPSPSTCLQDFFELCVFCMSILIYRTHMLWKITLVDTLIFLGTSFTEDLVTADGLLLFL